MDYSSLLQVVKNRRSIRRFKPGPVPDEYIDKIIEAARWAPSAYNSQPWDFVVIKDEKLRKVLTSFDLHQSLLSRMKTIGSSEERLRMMARPWHDEEWDYHAAPVFIVLYGDPRTKVALPDQGKSNSARTRLLLHSSLACAFVYMELAATTLGLATQWLSDAPGCYDALRTLIGVPEDFEPYGMIPLGYPAYRPRPKLLRPKEKMVHYEHCGTADFRTVDEVNEFARKTWIWTTAAHRRGVDKLNENFTGSQD